MNTLRKKWVRLVLLAALPMLAACTSETKEHMLTAEEILGHPDFQAISYSGYRENTREIVPTVEEIMEDMKILEAMGIKFIRTYDTQQFAHAEHTLKAIARLKKEDPDFEMYVMLGAWIDCKYARTDSADHQQENLEANTAEIKAAIRFANEYPDIVKVIAVGNEAMVHWAASYYVVPGIILKWVNHLQELKQSGDLPSTLWITSSDNFASWGGGDSSYHNADLEQLVEAVDFISMHTYPFHDSHYNPDYWLVPEDEANAEQNERILSAMDRALKYARNQYEQVAAYVQGLGIEKTIHIGETGWASVDNVLYGNTGSRAADEYKQKLYYESVREWTDEAGISCFFFEAFDEPWKDGNNPLGSENHFGLIDINGKAKYAIWDLVEQGVFEGLTRGGDPIEKSFGGNLQALLSDVQPPPEKTENE